LETVGMRLFLGEGFEVFLQVVSRVLDQDASLVQGLVEVPEGCAGQLGGSPSGGLARAV